MSVRTVRPNGRPGGAEPLSPQRKWRAITLATVLLVPAFWSLLAGLVASGANRPEGAPDPGAALALGLALIPFVFIVLSFLSQNQRAAGAVLKAMGLTILVGIPASALAGDGVTGVVAGIGAGGIIALRSEPEHSWRLRAAAVLAATLYTFVLVRVGGPIALLPAPILPFTGIGVADHIAESRTTSG
jgi:hypothetical protein